MNKKYLFLASFLLVLVLVVSFASAGIFDFLTGKAASDVSRDRGYDCRNEGCGIGEGDCRGRTNYCMAENSFCHKDIGEKYGLFRSVDVCECKDGFVPDGVGGCVENVGSRYVGDLNFDGVVTFADVKLLENHLSGINVLNSDQLGLADVNGDGQVNVLDSMELNERVVSTNIGGDSSFLRSISSFVTYRPFASHSGQETILSCSQACNQYSNWNKQCVLAMKSYSEEASGVGSNSRLIDCVEEVNITFGSNNFLDCVCY